MRAQYNTYCYVVFELGAESWVDCLSLNRHLLLLGRYDGQVPCSGYVVVVVAYWWFEAGVARQVPCKNLQLSSFVPSLRVVATRQVTHPQPPN